MYPFAYIHLNSDTKMGNDSELIHTDSFSSRYWKLVSNFAGKKNLKEHIFCVLQISETFSLALHLIEAWHIGSLQPK